MTVLTMADSNDAVVYRGYTGVYEWDQEESVFHGRVAGIDDIVAFVSGTLEGLQQEFRVSVDMYLDWRAEQGVEPE